MTHFDSLTWGSDPDSPSYPVEGVASGYKLARGRTTAAGAAATIATGLTSIVSYSLTLEGGTAAKANTAVLVTGEISSANILAYRWKHTSAGTTTLVAATTNGTIQWVAVGT
jgi:hypothetical protein